VKIRKLLTVASALAALGAVGTSASVSASAGPALKNLCTNTQAAVGAGYTVLFVPVGGLPFDGTSNDDVIIGTNFRDDIDAKGGDDVVCSLGGNDDVKGGNGEDSIFGDAGRDDLEGNSGGDFIAGGSQNDELRGGTQNDVLNGGGGTNTCTGGLGNDSLINC
jgi:Ca2+-binding RTX toxin-like protein